MLKKSLRTFGLLCAALSLLMVSGNPARAHKIKLFAMAEGKTISGYAYFSKRGRPSNVTVLVLGPNGVRLGETTTNDRGEFTFTAAYKCDHTLSLELADGHRAQFSIRAEELPDDLPLLEGTGINSLTDKAGDKQPVLQESDAAEQTLNATGTLTASTPEIERAVEKALSKQLRPLREQLDQLEEKIRLHDILGGIGYILGLAGITFYFLGVRRKENK